MTSLIMSTNRDKVLKYKCENSLLFFARYIYKENHNRKFSIAPHFIEISQTLERVANGEITRLIINIPPRYGKTELAIKIFISWCLSKWQHSKFIHLSYSDTLALDNSSQTKDYIQSDAYQKLWPMSLKKDAQSKSKWFNEYGGGVYATSTGGAITGFGAGLTKSKEFGGAIIIDDPHKPDDIRSEIKRKAVSDRYNHTIRNRINSENTPIIVIMQRLHEDDLSGFLLDGGSGEKWHHLCIPAIDSDNNALWPEKHTFEELENIRQANAYNFAGQYMQRPAPEEGGEWKKNWFGIIDVKDVPDKLQWRCYVDGAYTKDTQNDPTGIMIAGSDSKDLYILSSIDKYLEMPELIKFLPKHISSALFTPTLTKVEPKASGKSIVQLIRHSTKLNIAEIKGKLISMSKIERARVASPFIEGGRVFLVRGGWNENYLNQVATFPNAKHDEHVDLTCYAIDDLLSKSNGTIDFL